MRTYRSEMTLHGETPASKMWVGNSHWQIARDDKT